jgi:hypothetical protein
MLKREEVQLWEELGWGGMGWDGFGLGVEVWNIPARKMSNAPFQHKRLSDSIANSTKSTLPAIPSAVKYQMTVALD